MWLAPASSAMSSPSIVDPPAPTDGSQLLIFDIDSMSTTRLYSPGSSRENPVYSISSDDGVKHSTIVRGMPGSQDVIAKVHYTGSLKKSRGKLGEVTVGQRDPVPIESWLTIRPTTKSNEVVVKIHDEEYVWTSRPDGEGNIKHTVYEVSGRRWSKFKVH
jgi:hypothetical protein